MRYCGLDQEVAVKMERSKWIQDERTGSCFSRVSRVLLPNDTQRQKSLDF